MERTISSKIRIAHLNENNLLSRSQHGFLQRRSTCTNLLECFNDWTVCIQDKGQLTVVYIDFQKAFDVVSHRKLFIGLRHYSVRGTVLTGWRKKTGPPAILSYCKYSENSMTELRGNW